MSEIDPTQRLIEGFRAVFMKLKLNGFKIADAVGLNRRVSGLVSVLIPTLEERYELLASRCLPSVAAQTYQDFEVLVVSETYSESVAEAVASFDSRFRYLWDAPRDSKLLKAGPLAIWSSGAAPSLNLALRSSRGKFLARLDDDDSWLPEHLENGIELLRSSGAEFVSSNAAAPDGGLVALSDMSSNYFGSEFRWCRQDVPIGTPITWIFRSHLRSLKFNEKSWRKKWNKPVDYDFILRSGGAGVRMVFSEEVTANYMSRPGLGGLTGFEAYLRDNVDEISGEDWRD